MDMRKRFIALIMCYVMALSLLPVSVVRAEENSEETGTTECVSHELTKTEAEEATCTEAGNSEYYTCSVCSKYFSDANGTTEIQADSWMIPAGHKLTKTEAEAAKCTEAGNSEYYTCSGECKKYFSDAEGKNEIPENSWVIPASHKLTKTEAKEAKCTEAGNSEYYTCSGECKKYFSDAEGKNEIPENSWVIPASHKMTKTEAKEAKCTEAGNSEY